MRSQRHSFFFYLSALLTAFVGWWWFGLRHRPKQTEQQPKMCLKVSIAKPHRKSVKRYIDTVGQCVAYNSVTLIAKATATLEKVKSDNGGPVQKEEILFQFSQSAPKAALQQAEAQLALDKAKYELEELQLKRSEGLYAQKYVSQQEYDTYKANVAASKALLDIDQATIVQRKIDLEDRTITAPFSGEISKSEVDEGSYVNQGTTLATLNQLQPIYVDAFLSERHLRALLNAKREAIEVEARLIDDPSVMQKGTLVTIGNEVEKSTGTFDIRGEFANEAKQFWPGRSMDLKIYYETITNAQLIPESAIHEGVQGEFVYIINGQGLAEMKPITTEQTYDRWIVVHGLQDEDRVITSGSALLAPGIPVQSIQTIQPPASLQAFYPSSLDKEQWNAFVGNSDISNLWSENRQDSSLLSAEQTNSRTDEQPNRRTDEQTNRRTDENEAIA